MNGRSYEGLAALMPGVTNMDAGTALSTDGYITQNSMNINGTGQTGTLYTVDGKGKSEKKAEETNKTTIYSEISSNEIFRSISLPAEINPEMVTAVLDNGVLDISMAKASPAKKVTVMAKAA